MVQPYIEFDFEVSPVIPGVDILIAQLAEVGFESFVDNESGLKAYIPLSDWKDELLKTVGILGDPSFDINFQQKEIEPVNWNAKWEENFKPIVVSEDCVVRAPFHEPAKVTYELIIEPKMSFGTGHHETTWLILQYLLDEELEDKRVLDMGCGTGVLGILTLKLGARHLTAIDIDSWCVENTEENAVRNKVSDLSVMLGDATLLPETASYEVILANINRNILLADIPSYVKALTKDGVLYLSGFYEEDLDAITAACVSNGLQLEKSATKNQWVAAKFVPFSVS